MIQEVQAFVDMAQGYVNFILLGGLVAVGYCVRLARQESRDGDERIESSQAAQQKELSALNRDLNQVVGYIKALKNPERP